LDEALTEFISDLYSLPAVVKQGNRR